MRFATAVCFSIIALASALMLGCVAAADEPTTPELTTVEGEYIILKVHPDDLKALSDPEGWVANLDKIYEAYADLVGDVPFDGEKITILSVEENPGGWAVAGNPIKWHRPWIVKSFEQINKGDWLFGIMHEIGHDFDLDYRWVCDPEFFANFKMDYAIEKAKGKVLFEDKMCDYSDPDGLRLTDFYCEHEKERGLDEKLVEGGRETDPYHCKYTRIREEIGWEPFKKTFRRFLALPEDKVPLDALSKRSLFIHMLEEFSGVELLPRFIEYGFRVLSAEADTDLEYAEILRDRKWTAEISQRVQALTPSDDAVVSVQIAEPDEKVFDKGLGTHAKSEIIYDIGGKYSRFESVVGVTGRGCAEAQSGSITFEVYLDSDLAYNSPVLRGGNLTKEVSLDVSGVDELKLVVTDAQNWIGADHAGWGDAKLIDSEGEIVYLSDMEPVKAEQDYGELAKDAAIDGPLLFGYGPCTKDAVITARLNGIEYPFSRSDESGVWTCSLGPLPGGKHYAFLTIQVAGSPVKLHDMATVVIEGGD